MISKVVKLLSNVIENGHGYFFQKSKMSNDWFLPRTPCTLASPNHFCNLAQIPNLLDTQPLLENSKARLIALGSALLLANF